MKNSKIDKALFKGISIFVLIGLLLAGMIYANKSKQITYISYNEFYEQMLDGEIAEATLTDGPKFVFTMKNEGLRYETDNPRNPELKEILLKNNINVIEGNFVSTTSMIQTAVSIMFFGLAFYMAYRMLNKGNAGAKTAMALNAKTADQKSETSFRFDDVAGNTEAKDSVTDIIDFIKNPDKYSKYGARMPRGVIFYGPPGTGKTLMARAIAGEAGVPFYTVSGSDFVQMYVGVGAGRVRELFSKARENGKAVIFIDEIDALGKKRGSAAAGGNDEREQTLNALLTEMSGFDNKEGIVVIAATNRLDTLDEALLRPGRFDRQVEIGLPDLAGRKQILNLHAKNKPLSEDIDISNLAKQTVYFSGAMLENLLNEAAIYAAKKGTDYIESKDVDTAYYTIVAGSEKKDRSGIKQREREITAYHEAGHALAAKITSPDNIVSKITIIPSTKGAGGFCVNIPPDKMYYTKKEIEANVIVSLAGRASEEIIFGKDNVTTGASNDIERATAMIKDYVVKYGMCDGVGIINASIASNDNGSLIFQQCSENMERLYKEALELIKNNRDKLENIVASLLEKETLNEDELDELISV